MACVAALAHYKSASLHGAGHSHNLHLMSLLAAVMTVNNLLADVEQEPHLGNKLKLK